MCENASLCTVISCFEYSNTWFSLEHGKKLQHFLLDRVAKFTYLWLEQGQGFIESAKPPYPNSCWVHPLPPLHESLMGVVSTTLLVVRTITLTFDWIQRKLLKIGLCKSIWKKMWVLRGVWRGNNTVAMQNFNRSYFGRFKSNGHETWPTTLLPGPLRMVRSMTIFGLSRDQNKK